jgi:hypothetical protein
MIESLAALATNMKAAELAQQINVALLAKTLDMAETQSADLVEMIRDGGIGGAELERLALPDLGANLDVIA